MKNEEQDIEFSYKVMHCPICDFTCGSDEEFDLHIKEAHSEFTETAQY